MARDPRYDILFEPVRIGPVTAPNRFLAVPHATGHSALMPNGSAAMRAMKAEGGWGVVATQLAEIDPTSELSNLPVEVFWDEQDVARHAFMVEKVKAHGALAAIEIGHTGLRARNLTSGMSALAPTGLPILKPEMPVHAKTMDLDDIKRFRQSHRDAVKRARRAGYDIVYVYAAHDASLLWHFLSPLTNHRSDAYGGPLDNRIRLLREVLTDSLEAAAGEVAVALRVAVHEFKPGSPLTCDREGREVVERLAELPDLWDVNVSGWSRDSGPSRFDEEGFQERYTDFVKTLTSKPVVGVGRFTSPDAMVSQIRRGVLDLVGAARPSIADPFLPAKIRDGRPDEIRECIGCNVCVATDGLGIPIRCTQNPTISEEWRRGWHPERIATAREAKRILVVGSGPAGLEAALTLAKARHEVVLAERALEFGGRAARESRLAGLAAWSRVRDYRLFALRAMNNVTLYPASPMQAEDVLGFDADHVVVATGSRWRGDGLGRTRYKPIPGFEGAAATPDDIMDDDGAIEGSIIVYDDDQGYMGSVCALHLAMRGHAVDLVSPAASIGGWQAYTLELPRVTESLVAAGVRLHANAKALAWEAGALTVRRADSGEPLPPLRAARLVSVTARRSDTGLADALQRHGERSGRFSIVGDCVAPGLIQAAVYSGHRLGRELFAAPEEMRFRREKPTLFRGDESHAA